MAYSENLKDLFPAYNCKTEKEKTVIFEHSNDAKIKKVVWRFPLFHSLDPKIAKDLKILKDKMEGNPIFGYDCDGIFICEKGGKKYFIFNELKSTFDSSDIFHAKQQIISSYLKLNMLLHVTQGYRNEDFEIKGFIFSHPPKPSYLKVIKDSLRFPPFSKLRLDGEFTGDFIETHKGRKTYKPNELTSLRGIKLGERGIFREMELFHIAVPEGSDTIELDLDIFL